MDENTKPWRVLPYGRWDKTIHVEGPDQLVLRVDHDDVDRDRVERAVEQMVDALNAVAWAPVPRRDYQLVLRGLCRGPRGPLDPAPYEWREGDDPQLKPFAGCHAGRDGECNWKKCPQTRDGESARSGRHCPLDRLDGEEE